MATKPNFVYVVGLQHVLTGTPPEPEYIATTQWWINTDHIIGIHRVDTHGELRYGDEDVYQVILPGDDGLMVSETDAAKLIGRHD